MQFTKNILQFLTSLDYIITYKQVSTTVLAFLRLIVVELFLSDLAADYPFKKHLGFNLMPYVKFFLLSPLSHPHHTNQISCCSFYIFRKSQQFNGFSILFTNIGSKPLPYESFDIEHGNPSSNSFGNPDHFNF